MCQRPCSATSTRMVRVVGGIPIPGLASMLSDPSDGTATVIQGLDTVPADERPTDSQVNVVHLAWDVMVGMGHVLDAHRAVVRRDVDYPARHAEIGAGSCSSHRRPA